MARIRRATAGFNLAFLDIMACGLGAITLIFMLVKYHAEPTREDTDFEAELAQLRAQVDALQTDNDATAARIEILKQELKTRTDRRIAAEQDAAQAADELIKISREITALERQLKDADKTAAKKPEQDHLIGLAVSGARILILLDNSASMADERLVDIVKIKAGDVHGKKTAPKWLRALSVVDWILARVPPDSEYMIVHYNARADFLPDNTWRKGDDIEARKAVAAALAELYPQRATNLDAALDLAEDINPSDIYLITDSLPTRGGSTIKHVAKCGIGNTVSGMCRAALFEAAVNSFSTAARVNTILLPVEGDPRAAHAYWLWSATTGGIMISPTGNWP